MPIDIIFFIAFAIGFRHGYTRGIISTVFNIMAYVFGIVLAFKITPTTTNLLERLFNSQNPSMYIAAFLVNLAILMFAMRQTANALEGLMNAIYLGAINRVLGGVVMGVVAIVIYSVLVWFSVKVEFVNNATLAESRTYPFLKDLPGKAKTALVRLKPMAAEVWDSSLSWMDRLEKYGLEKTEGKQKVYEIPEDPDGPAIEDEPTSAPTGRRPSVADDNGIEY
ncbi:MAG TPA: CvpA family protein [Saprospiraceae bacterium]|nr:CvpA family protein [Saprospiraceae bacterium]HND90018.1 CvpA family protein [Saprospiraceae bacterium]HNG90817.1 CvpA family protein [Saprospiraceae bacterium]